jgi:hypothetical protein
VTDGNRYPFNWHLNQELRPAFREPVVAMTIPDSLSKRLGVGQNLTVFVSARSEVGIFSSPLRFTINQTCFEVADLRGNSVNTNLLEPTQLVGQIPVASLALERIVNLLPTKDYGFITHGKSGDLMKKIEAFDQFRTGIGSKLFGFMIGGSDLSTLSQKLLKNTIGFGTVAVTDQELNKLIEELCDSFPISALKVSRYMGPMYTAILCGDTAKQEQIISAVTKFQQLNESLLHIGGRATVRLLGKNVAELKGSHAIGNLIVITSTSSRAAVVREWVSKIPLRNDTALNQFKSRFSRWQTYAKLVVGMVEVQVEQLKQEVIIVDAETNRATSSVSLRLPYEFGFSLKSLCR